MTRQTYDITRKPQKHNKIKGTAYITFYEEQDMKDGVVNAIYVEDEHGKKHKFEPKDVLKALGTDTHTGEVGPYRCFNFKALLLEILETQNPPGRFVELKHELSTSDMQKEFGIPPTKLHELHDFDFLIPCRRIGNCNFYSRAQVLLALQNANVKIWLSNIKAKYGSTK